MVTSRSITGREATHGTVPPQPVNRRQATPLSPRCCQHDQWRPRRSPLLDLLWRESDDRDNRIVSSYVSRSTGPRRVPTTNAQRRPREPRNVANHPVPVKCGEDSSW
jgi:hypothetical protein